METPAGFDFTTDGLSGRLRVREKSHSARATHFDVELDCNLGGIWPRLHVEVEHRGGDSGSLIFTNEPRTRDVAFRGRSMLSFSPGQDPDVSRAVAERLRGCLTRLGVQGEVSLLTVDTSVETGEWFGVIMVEVAGTVIFDHATGAPSRFEEVAHGALDRALRASAQSSDGARE